MNVIIMAAIGLVILIVLITLLTNKTAIFSKSVGGSCKDQGGTCLYDQGKDSCSEIEGKPIRVIASGCESSKKDSKKDSGPCCLPLK